MSTQKCTDTHMHGHTGTHMTEWLAADKHRWGVEERRKSKSLYLIAQQSGVECSAYFEHVQISVLFCRSVLFIFRFSSVLCSPFSFSWLRLGVSPRKKKNTKKKRKKEKIKSIGKKRGGIKKKKSSLIFRFLELWFFRRSVLSCWCTSAGCGCSGGVCTQGLRTRLRSQYAVFFFFFF